MNETITLNDIEEFLKNMKKVGIDFSSEVFIENNRFCVWNERELYILDFDEYEIEEEVNNVIQLRSK